MPYKSKAEYKEYKRKWNLRNKIKQREYLREWRKKKEALN